MSVSKEQAQPRSSVGFWRAYMFSWALLAVGATSYLSVLALDPDYREKLLATPPKSTPESNRAEIERAQLTAKVRMLNETVASLRSEMARYRVEDDAAKPRDNAGATETTILNRTAPGETQTATPAEPAPAPTSSNPIMTGSLSDGTVGSAEAEREPANDYAPRTDRLDATGFTTEPLQPAQEAPSSPAAVASPAPPAAAFQPSAPEHTAQPATPLRKGPNLAISPLRTGKVPPLPRPDAARPGSPQPVGPRADAGPISDSTPVETALSPDAAIGQPIVITMPKPKTTAAPTQSRTAPAATFEPTRIITNSIPSQAALALSSATSVNGLRASWLLLTDNHKQTLAGFQPRYVADQRTGSYRLLAGPIANRTEADRLCTQLRARAVTCGVTEFNGSPL